MNKDHYLAQSIHSLTRLPRDLGIAHSFGSAPRSLLRLIGTEPPTSARIDGGEGLRRASGAHGDRSPVAF